MVEGEQKTGRRRLYSTQHRLDTKCGGDREQRRDGRGKKRERNWGSLQKRKKRDETDTKRVPKSK